MFTFEVSAQPHAAALGHVPTARNRPEPERGLHARVRWPHHADTHNRHRCRRQRRRRHCHALPTPPPLPETYQRIGDAWWEGVWMGDGSYKDRTELPQRPTGRNCKQNVGAIIRLAFVCQRSGAISTLCAPWRPPSSGVFAFQIRHSLLSASGLWFRSPIFMWYYSGK